MNNPVMYQDPTGEAATVVIVAANWWNPLGWIAAGVTIVVVVESVRAASKNSLKASPKTFKVSTTASPDPNEDPNKSLKQIKSNPEANKVAKDNGYKGAEALKADFVGKTNGSKFNIFRNTKTGELILKAIEGNTQISTGLFN